jgi:peptidyl-prolyl cis-trans isomerase B (cyclophilin B)
VPNRKTRNRQLARVAQQRYAERRRRRRQQRLRVTGAVLGVVVIAGVVFFTTRGGPSTAGALRCSTSVPAAASVKKPTFAHPPEMTIDPSKTYTATIDTSCGTVVVKLLADRAPTTVNSFVFLANKHFFDGTQIHRIDTSIGIIQGGDPTGTGTGGPGYKLPDELTGKESYGPGVVAMANSGANTGGSQFFIVYDQNGHKLDANPNYTIFGRVVRGLDVVQRIARIPVQNAAGGLSGQKPTQAVYLDKVTVSAG